MPGRADTRHEVDDGRPGRERGDRRGIRTDVPRRDVHRRRDAPLGDRDAGQRGHAERGGDAGHDGDLDPGRAAGVHLFPAAAEHVGVAALEPHDGEPLQRPVDEDPVDLGLRHRVVGRALADVDDLDVGGQPVEQAGGAEPVGDDDVGGREGLEPGDRHQARVARAAADEHDPSAPLAPPPQVDRPGLDVVRQGVAHRRDPARVGVARRHDPDGEVAVGARRRHPGGAVAAVGGVDAPGAALLAPRRDLRVERRVGGRRDDEPGALDVGLDDCPLPRPRRRRGWPSAARRRDGLGSTSTTRAPSSTSRRARRVPTAPAPTTRTRRPTRSRPTRVVTQQP